MRDILLVLMEGEAAYALLQCQQGGPSLNLLIICHVISVVCTSGTPSGVSYSDVRDHLLKVKGVTAVHNLHIWALTMNQAVLTAHVAIGERK